MRSTHRDLVAWQRAMDLCERVYRTSASLPQDERYGLREQMRRASVSIPANIAEGHGRSSNAEFRHFLHIARGSLRELETHADLVARLGMLSQDAHRELVASMDATGRVLTGLITSQKDSRPQAPVRSPRNP